MTTRLMEHEAKGGGKAHCVSPPNPGLAVERDQALPATGSADLVDARSDTLIAARPKRTRPDTFVSTTREFAPITGVSWLLTIPPYVRHLRGCIHLDHGRVLVANQFTKFPAATDKYRY